MKVVERMVEKLIRELISIDDMQFGFMPGVGTIDAVFILRQLQEKHIGKRKILYFAFVDLEKAFDRVPRKVLWWAMRKLGVSEWIVQLVQAMYMNARSRVRVNNTYTDEFGVNVGVHQGSVLSPLLFIIVLEALSQEFRTGCPWELLYADDLVIIDESLEGLRTRLRRWKDEMEAKGLRVNMPKTKVMISGAGLHTLRDSGDHPCGVCRSGVGSNSIFCGSCSHWVHKKCSGIRGRLIADENFKCKRCTGEARPIDVRPIDKLDVGEESLEVVDKFPYLGDTVDAGGGSELSSIARSKIAWGKFREYLPLLTSRSLSLSKRGEIYDSVVRNTMIYASECWAPSHETVQRVKRTDRAMIRWICGVKLVDRVNSNTLLSKLGLPDVESALRQRRLRWYGHVQRSTGWINRCTVMDVAGVAGRGRPRMTWQDGVNKDRRLWGMDNIDPGDRASWRSALRAAVKH